VSAPERVRWLTYVSEVGSLVEGVIESLNLE